MMQTESEIPPIEFSQATRSIEAIADEVSSFQVEKYKIERSKSITMRKSVRTKASVNREVLLLSRIFTLAISNREARFNPVSEVKLFKGETRRTRYLLPEEEGKLMAALTGRRATIRLLVVVALQTGMRRGEIMKLKRSDIDFHRGEIHVTGTKTNQNRVVPINETLRFELQDHLGRVESSWVFASPKPGGHIVEIRKSFARACSEAGVEDFRFHDLRHTAATRMGEAGIDPFTIAAILGHKNIAMTASYTHATQTAKRRAVAALEEANRETGPQIGHKERQPQALVAVK
jgi:integrase